MGRKTRRKEKLLVWGGGGGGGGLGAGRLMGEESRKKTTNAECKSSDRLAVGVGGGAG